MSDPNVWTPPEANACYFPGVKLRISWWFAHTCKNRCFYCSSHAGYTQRAKTGARWWTDDLAVAAWQQVFDRYGPVLIELTGLEASEQPELVARVLNIGHKGMMNTNLGFDLERWKAAGVPTDRLVLCSSFHPHQWQFNVGAFIDKALAVKRAGYNLITASLVAHPVYLQHVQSWLQAIREGAGLGTSVHPYIGHFAKWNPSTRKVESLFYPTAYTEEEQAMQRGEMEEKKVEFALEFRKPDIATCATGWLYARVDLDGTVHRCMHQCEAGAGAAKGMKPQNFFRDPLTLNSGPLPCEFPQCYCEQLFQYHVPHGSVVKC